jgi:hypothetical protein
MKVAQDDIEIACIPIVAREKTTEVEGCHPKPTYLPKPL